MPADVLVGTVRSPELARATLTIGKESHHRRLGDHVVIGFDDGSERRLIVEAPHVLSKYEKRDQWEDLVAQPLAQLFADVAPGDHVKCELEGWRIAPGTRIAFSHDGDEIRIIAVVDRDAATAIDDVRQILRERAARVPAPAPAPKPPPELPPTKPWRRNVLVHGTMGIVGAALTVVMWVDPVRFLEKERPTPIAFGLLVPSLYCLTMALLLVLSRPWFEAVDTHASSGGRFRAPWSYFGLLVGLACSYGLVDLSAGVPMLGIHPPFVTGIRLFTIAAIALVAFILVVRAQRPQRRLARLLRSQTQLGTVIADQPPLARSVRYEEKAKTTGHGERASTTVWFDGISKSEANGPFAIAIDGVRHEVTGQRVMWGAPLTYDRVEKSGPDVARTRAVILPGASVLVRGKSVVVNGVPTFQATGAESFVLFGAPGNARSTLRKLLVRWYAGAAVIAAIAIGGTAYGVYLIKLEPKPPVPAERPY